MSQFVPIHSDELNAIITAAQALQPPAVMRIPPEYHSKILPIRLVFWQRLKMLHQLIQRFAPNAKNCLDFGGGGGVFIPTLAASFAEVTLLDLHVGEARVVKDRYGLKHLELVEQDATQCDLGEGRFDVVVAADVLEHFLDVDSALTPIKRWLKKGGLLVTSLPTETRTYELLRFIFRTEKPEDHYHSAEQVEQMIKSRGFTQLTRRYAPLPGPVFPLFYISAWRND